MILSKYIELIESMQDSGYFKDNEGQALISNVTYYLWKLIFKSHKYHYISEENKTKKHFRNYLNKHNIKVKGIIDEYIRY